jgi:hypothetical protein
VEVLPLKGWALLPKLTTEAGVVVNKEHQSTYNRAFDPEKRGFRLKKDHLGQVMCDLDRDFNAISF